MAAASVSERGLPDHVAHRTAENSAASRLTLIET